MPFLKNHGKTFVSVQVEGKEVVFNKSMEQIEMERSIFNGSLLRTVVYRVYTMCVMPVA